MNILGIHAFSHDAGACLITKEGICALAEERLTRIKYAGGFPEKSIKYVLEHFGIKDINKINLIVYDRLGPLKDKNNTLNCLKKLGYNGETIGIDHHDAHAASSFFVSPFKNSAILVVDGFGTSVVEKEENFHYLFYLNNLVYYLREAQSIYLGEGNRIKLLRRTFATPQFSFGIGMFYGFASVFLGFGELGAGKLMALAAYGGKKKILNKPFFKKFRGEIIGGEDIDNRDKDPACFSDFNLSYYGKKIFNYAKPRKADEPIKKIHTEIANYVQKGTEEAILCCANDLYEITKNKNLCYSGGVALNCLTNTRIIKESKFKNIFIQPAATDSGIPLGCALYGYHLVKKMPRRFVMQDVFLGKEYKEKEILSILKKIKTISYTKPGNLIKEVAKYLSEGKIIGWFTGKSELGPRALGHRSILADPRKSCTKEILNKKIKHREWFRPYAPAILEEFVNEYFDINYQSPFMLLTAKVKANKKKLIPAVIHIDGTARVQSVSKKNNPQFYNLIKEFYKITGVPMILNTSFNLNGEPIVETPEDAINCFLKTALNCLVLEKFLITKNTFNNNKQEK